MAGPNEPCGFDCGLGLPGKIAEDAVLEITGPFHLRLQAGVVSKDLDWPGELRALVIPNQDVDAILEPSELLLDRLNVPSKLYQELQSGFPCCSEPLGPLLLTPRRSTRPS